MRLSDIIEAFIKDNMKADGEVLIQRNELANHFNCVPSQINYVISTRFTSDHGYYVESKRGGGGNITIRRVEMRNISDYLMHIVTSMGDTVSQQTAEVFLNNFMDYLAVSKREGAILKAAVSDKNLMSIAQPDRDKIRASILKNIMMAIVTA